MRFPLLAALAAAVCLSSVAHADPITSNGASTYTIAPSSDTLTLNAGNDDVSSGGSFTVNGTFYVGYSPIADQNIAFTIDDDFTANGVTQTLTFNVIDYVDTNTDSLFVDALGPVMFGDATLTFGSFLSDPGGVNATLPVSIPVTYQAAAVTPEPSSLLLLGTGALSAAAAYRRRFLNA